MVELEHTDLCMMVFQEKSFFPVFSFWVRNLYSYLVPDSTVTVLLTLLPFLVYFTLLLIYIILISS